MISFSLFYECFSYIFSPCHAFPLSVVSMQLPPHYRPSINDVMRRGGGRSSHDNKCKKKKHDKTGQGGKKLSKIARHHVWRGLNTTQMR